MSNLSPLRAKLAGYENCYSVAIRRRATSGRNQFVVRTGDPLQPFRVTARQPDDYESLVLRVA